MRRKMGPVANGRQKSFVYTCALVGLTVYGVPRLPQLTTRIGGTFTAVWLLFVALCIGANLYFLFGADRERKRLLETQAVRAHVPEQTREAGKERARA